MNWHRPGGHGGRPSLPCLVTAILVALAAWGLLMWWLWQHSERILP